MAFRNAFDPNNIGEWSTAPDGARLEYTTNPFPQLSFYDANGEYIGGVNAYRDGADSAMFFSAGYDSYSNPLYIKHTPLGNDIYTVESAGVLGNYFNSNAYFGNGGLPTNLNEFVEEWRNTTYSGPYRSDVFQYYNYPSGIANNEIVFVSVTCMTPYFTDTWDGGIVQRCLVDSGKKEYRRQCTITDRSHSPRTRGTMVWSEWEQIYPVPHPTIPEPPVNYEWTNTTGGDTTKFDFIYPVQVARYGPICSMRGYVKLKSAQSFNAGRVCTLPNWALPSSTNHGSCISTNGAQAEIFGGTSSQSLVIREGGRQSPAGTGFYIHFDWRI